MTKLVELNHIIEDGMPAYPGLPSPQIGAVMDHDQSRSRYGWKAEFYLGRVVMPGNCGTYLDSPFHRHREKADLSRVPIEKIARLPGLVLDAAVASRAPVRINCDPEKLAGRAVLIRTGWDARWGTARYWEPAPYLAGEFVDLLVKAKPALVGVDFWNVDNTEDLSRPAHTGLLAADILIVENLRNLGALPFSGFRFYAVPLRIVRGASFPIRAFAEVES
jgi:kynurenine formamidase